MLSVFLSQYDQGSEHLLVFVVVFVLVFVADLLKASPCRYASVLHIHAYTGTCSATQHLTIESRQKWFVHTCKAHNHYLQHIRIFHNKSKWR